MNSRSDAQDDLFGITLDFVTKLRNGAIKPEEAKRFLRKENPWPALIDLDADPLVPDGLTVTEHQKGGQWLFDPKQIELFLDVVVQNGGTYDSALELRHSVRGKPVLNANALDWLLTHQEQIPEAWMEMTVYFWGTIYEGAMGPCVRGIYYDRGRWEAIITRTDFFYCWRKHTPAALLVAS